MPVTAVWYGLYAWMSVENQRHGGKWFWIVTLWGFLPIWSFVSRHSKALVFDALLYDVLMLLAFQAGLLALRAQGPLQPHQYVGILLVAAGIVLVKV